MEDLLLVLLVYPTSDLMAINLNDHISGVFWAAFLLFSWIASIVSGPSN